jgi:hypothetical protein
MHYSATNKITIFLVFFFFLIINFVSTGGHTDVWDGMVTFLLAESMATKQTAKLHPDIPTVSNSNPADPPRSMIGYEVQYNMIVTGRYAEWVQQSMPLEPVYSTRSLLLPAISVPFYYAAVVTSLAPTLVIPFFVNSFIIALTSLVVFCFSLELYSSKKIAFLLGLIFTGCSFILPYNTSFFPQPLQSLLIITAAFFIFKSLHFHSAFICSYTRNYDALEIANKKRSLFFASLGGLLLGLSVFAHPTSVIVIPGFVAYSFFSMRRNKKSLISFLLAVSIALFFVGLVNYLRFGSFTEFGYGSYYGTLSYNTYGGSTGLVGLLASPGKGLIIYFPVVILLPLALKYMYGENRWLFFLISYIITVHWLYFGTLADTESRFWSGELSWGPRYLVPLLPLITLALGTLLARFKQSRSLLRGALLVLCFTGFIVNLPGILVWSPYGTIYAWNEEGLASVPNSLDVIAWNPNHSPVILHFKALMEDYVGDINPEQWLHTSWHYISYGLAPCSYDLYLFCNWGIIPIVALLSIDVYLALKIMNNVSIVSIRELVRKIEA